MNNTAIVIPAYNEEVGISETILEYFEYFGEAFFLIVDNNSTDDTADKALKCLKDYNIRGEVLFEGRQGKANAVYSAFRRYQFDWWILTDADLTYPASDMYELYKLLVRKKIDHGILDRISCSSYVNDGFIKTQIHKFGNKLITNLVSNFSNVSFRDVLSGGRVFNSPFIETLVIRSKGFELETELNLHSSEISASNYEHPCGYRKRQSGDPSKLSPFVDGYKIIKHLCQWFLVKNLNILILFLGIFFLTLGIFAALHLLNIYLKEGAVVYSSYSVATSMFLIAGLIFVVLSIYIQSSRNTYTKNLELKFNYLKRRWIHAIDKSN